MTARAEIRIALELKPLPIPYPAVKHDDGENFGYKSLVASPEAIEQIPELVGEHAMKEFVAHINSQEGIFETVRMVQWFNHAEGRTTQCLCLGFIFRDHSLFANYANCVQFAGHLLEQMVSGGVEIDGPPLFEIQPAHRLQEKAAGWIMDLYVAGSGANEESARQRLAQVLTSMRPLFETGG